jgi:HD superfamily phosphodiesterase
VVLVEALRAEVKRACKAPTNAFGYGIWSHHIVHVVAHGRALSATLGADAEIVEVAALLHDYAGIKDACLAPEHHLHGVQEAERLLTELGYPRARTEAVKHCILTHRASRALEPRTLEAITLASADAMAHISQAASLLYLAYVQKGLDVEDGAAWVKGKLERSYRKLCPEAKGMMGADYRAARRFLDSVASMPE